MAYDWNRLILLAAPELILYTEPRLDTKEEVWFYLKDSNLVIHRDGQLERSKKILPAVLSKRVSERLTLYKLADSLFVDVETRGDHAVLRRGVLNGAFVCTVIPSASVTNELTRYRKLGFKDGTPYNPNASKSTLREYRGNKSWTIHIDGSSVFQDWRSEKKFVSRDAAIIAAEKLIVSHEKKGFRLVLIELAKTNYANPTPKQPKSAPKTRVPTRLKIAKPKNPFEGVDSAILRLKDLHSRVCRYHTVAELINVKSASDKARVAEVEPHVDYFLKFHKKRLGRWVSAKPMPPKKGESSWDYFLRIYGSITWVLSGSAEDDLAMFYCGNVSGGGWSCLEIADDIYDTRELAKALGNKTIEQLKVFHGGWHMDKGFAFDTRAKSDSNEYPIVPFDEGDPILPAKWGKPIAFGDWLFARVEKLTRKVEQNLRELL